MVTYVSKANDEVLSDCTCTDAIAAGPAQMDCPWCGCGWLMTCMTCRKAFTFARVIEVDRTYEDIAREDFTREGSEFSEQEVADGAAWLADAFSEFKVGDIVVYLDGSYLKLDTADFAYEGWFAQHEFDRLPHAVALEQPGALQEMLGDQEYWLERELVDQV